MEQHTLPGQVDNTIDSIAELEHRALAAASLQQRAIERFTMTIGRPRTIWIAVAAVAAWIALNAVLRASGHAEPDPPPYFWLDGALSLSAVLMTIVILTTENRMSQLEEQRSRLNLQISMLAERKTAKIIQLLEELRRDTPSVRDRHDREAEEMTVPADPHAVVRELERRAPARGEIPPAPTNP